MIYSLDEYQVAKDLGFEKIIYNTDRIDDTYDEVAKFIEDGGDLFSVAITAKEVESDFFDNLLADDYNPVLKS